MTAEELFWDLVEPMYADPAVQRSTMMSLPCLRRDGRFLASLDRRTGALLIKLPAERVRQLIDAGHGQEFAPAGRAFREWVAITAPDRQRWQARSPRPTTTPLPRMVSSSRSSVRAPRPVPGCWFLVRTRSRRA
jgi:hypothetical protein